jgi:hypothetical protein
MCTYFLGLCSLASATGGAFLSLSPSVAEVTAGKDLTVAVHLNTGGENVNAVQADISYPLEFIDPAQSKAQCIKAFPTQAQSILNATFDNQGYRAGLIKIACAVAADNDSGAVPFKGEVDVATIKLHIRSNAPYIHNAKMLNFIVDQNKGNYSAVARAEDSSNILSNTSSADVTITSTNKRFSRLDINNDTSIDTQDLSILINSFNLKASELKNPKVDINKDKIVNCIDLSILLSNQL